MRGPLLAVAALSLAGCIGGSAPEPAAPLEVPAMLPSFHELRFEGCNEQSMVLPVPAALVAGYLPAGFTPVALDPAGLVGFGFATTWTCPGGPVGGELKMVSEHHAFLAASPPAGMAREGADFQGVAIVVSTTSEANLERYAAWEGAPVRNVSGISLDILVDQETLRMGEARVAYAEGTETFRGATSGMTESSPAGTARVFLVKGGEVAGYVDADWTASSYRGTGGSVLAYDGPPGFPPPPLYPGLAAHWWGESYAIHLEHVGHAPEAGSQAAGPALAGRFARLIPPGWAPAPIPTP
jgi:hypothetical protein